MNILVTGIGGPTPKGIAKSLRLAYGDVNIIGIDADKYAPGLYHTKLYKSTYLVPDASKDTYEYWLTIEKIVKKEEIDFAFVIPETEIIEWSKKESNDKLPCKSLIPPLELATFLFDKLRVANFLEEHNLTPITRMVNGENLNEVQKILNYPYWIRVNKTAGAIGALKITDNKDVENWLSINDSNAEFIASEFLPGRNYACKLLYKSGKLLKGAVGERIEYLLPNSSPSKISGMCARGRLLNDQEVFQIGDKAMHLIFKKFQMEPHGMFTVDLKSTEDDIPKITEINLRHVSFTHAFTLGGINLAKLTVDNFLKEQNDSLTEGQFLFPEEYNFLRGVDNELFIFKDSDIKKSLSPS